MTREAYIVDAVRTPVGRKKGGLSRVHPADLGVSRWVVAPWGDDLESCKRILGTMSETLVGPLA